MKTRINLYRSEYKPQLDLLTLNAVLTVFMLLIFIVFGVHYALYKNVAGDKLRLASIKSDVQMQNNFVEELTSQLEQREEDPALIAIFKGLQETYKQKQQLKNLLQQRQHLQSSKFSDMLNALSEQHTDDLWLTNITVSESVLSFEGEVVQPDAVPEWVTRLGKTQYFSGQSFTDARLVRDDSRLRFSLSTRRDKLLQKDSGRSE